MLIAPTRPLPAWLAAPTFKRFEGTAMSRFHASNECHSLRVSANPIGKVWDHLYRDTTHELASHVSEYGIAGILVLDSITAYDSENPRPCDQW